MRTATVVLGALFGVALLVATTVSRHARTRFSVPGSREVSPAAAWVVAAVVGIALVAVGLSAAGSYSRAEVALIARAAAWEVETYPGGSAVLDVEAAVVMHGDPDELQVARVRADGVREHWQITNDEGEAAVCLQVTSVYADGSRTDRTFEAAVLEAACD